MGFLTTIKGWIDRKVKEIELQRHCEWLSALEDCFLYMQDPEFFKELIDKRSVTIGGIYRYPITVYRPMLYLTDTDRLLADNMFVPVVVCSCREQMKRLPFKNPLRYPAGYSIFLPPRKFIYNTTIPLVILLDDQLASWYDPKNNNLGRILASAVVAHEVGHVVAGHQKKFEELMTKLIRNEQTKVKGIKLVEAAYGITTPVIDSDQAEMQADDYAIKYGEAEGLFMFFVLNLLYTSYLTASGKITDPDPIWSHLLIRIEHVLKYVNLKDVIVYSRLKQTVKAFKEGCVLSPFQDCPGIIRLDKKVDFFSQLHVVCVMSLLANGIENPSYIPFNPMFRLGCLDDYALRKRKFLIASNEKFATITVKDTERMFDAIEEAQFRMEDMLQNDHLENRAVFNNEEHIARIKECRSDGEIWLSNHQ